MKTLLLTMALSAAAALAAHAGDSWTAEKIGAGQDRKSDGLFLFKEGKKSFLLEQSWDGDARIWTRAGGKWTSEPLYTKLGQCFSPLAFDFDGSGEYSFFVGSWNRKGGVHEIRLRPDGKPTKEVSSIPGSAACGSILCLRTGSARGDGIVRLYVGSEGQGGGLHEFAKAKGQWQSTKIRAGSVGEFAIGDGRNDGATRIYGGDRGGRLFELSWDGGAWAEAPIPLPAKGVKAVALGDGRGDGKNRLYVNAGGQSFEVAWADGQWAALPTGARGTRYYFVPMPFRQDGQGRILSTVQGVGLFAWTWNGSGYDEERIDAMTSATGGIAVGDGRGDGVMRAYVTNGDRQKSGAVIWELTPPGR